MHLADYQHFIYLYGVLREGGCLGGWLRVFPRALPPLIFSTELAICCRFAPLFRRPLLGLGGSGGQHIA